MALQSNLPNEFKFGRRQQTSTTPSAPRVPLAPTHARHGHHRGDQGILHGDGPRRRVRRLRARAAGHRGQMRGRRDDVLPDVSPRRRRRRAPPGAPSRRAMPRDARRTHRQGVRRGDQVHRVAVHAIRARLQSRAQRRAGVLAGGRQVDQRDGRDRSRSRPAQGRVPTPGAGDPMGGTQEARDAGVHTRDVRATRATCPRTMRCINSRRQNLPQDDQGLRQIRDAQVHTSLVGARRVDTCGQGAQHGRHVRARQRHRRGRRVRRRVHHHGVLLPSALLGSQVGERIHQG